MLGGGKITALRGVEAPEREVGGKAGTIDDLNPCHLACLFLPSRLWAFRSPLWTLKPLT